MIDSSGIPQRRQRKQAFPTLCEERQEESGGCEENQGRQSGEWVSIHVPRWHWGWLERLEVSTVLCPILSLPKGQGSRSRSGSQEQSYSRSPSRSASPKRRCVLLGCMGLQQAPGCFLGKWCGLSLGTVAPDPEMVGMGCHLPGGLLHRKSDSGSTSGGSKSQSRSRSRSDSPPRQAHRGAPYKGSKVRSYRRSKDCKYSAQKPHKSRSRSSSRSRSRSRERADTSGKYKKKSHYYRDQRRERSRSYERTGHRYERDHPGHSRHRR